ncbi:MAG TPA: hypothetical protein VFB84_04295 [Micromonosporaceae bacterium]|nr:hypothetical protein [Micromonosporaceae bacterium]
MYRRVGLAALAGMLAVLGVAACGVGPARQATGSGEVTDSVEVTADLPAEAMALAAMGFNEADMVAAGVGAGAAAPAPSGGPEVRPSGDARAEGWRKRHAVRVFLRRNVLHGEAVVQAKDGTTKTVVVQRGTVTAIDATTVTVKSADGYTLTWTFGDPLHVVEHRTSVKPEDVAVGAQVGVAGVREGDKVVARLVLIRRTG